MQNQTNVYVKRTFNCSQKELFNWVTNPELLVQWFGPSFLKTGSVETDPRKGGSYRIQMIPETGSSFYITGQYLEVIHYSQINFSYSYEGISEPMPDSEVHINLEEAGSHTVHLSLTQKFSTTPPEMGRRTQAWEFMMGRLADLLG
jgi:uncharacterized protein YndB with AHSA1/START domain